jgi:hypothetical protein
MARVIDLVSKAIVDHLLSRTTDLGAGWVELTSLESGGNLSANKLHVCLYAIDEHDHLRNAPLVESKAGWVRPPLALRLSYAMTYVSNQHVEVQARLARVLQVFHSTPVLGPESLPPEVAALVQRVTVRLQSPGDEQRNHLWTAFGRGMRLALYYLVDVALVPPIQQEGAGTVREHRVEYAAVTR